MNGSNKRRRPLWSMWIGLALLACLGATGCQSSVGGQILPSPYYLTDDVQYYPAGPEFKLAREAAAMKAHSQDATQQQAAQPQAAQPPQQ